MQIPDNKLVIDFGLGRGFLAVIVTSDKNNIPNDNLDRIRRCQVTAIKNKFKNSKEESAPLEYYRMKTQFNFQPKRPKIKRLKTYQEVLE